VTVDATLAPAPEQVAPRGPLPVPELDGVTGLWTTTPARTLPVPAPDVGQPAPPPAAPHRDSGREPTPPSAQVRTIALLAVVLVLSVLVGELTGSQGRALIHNKMLPWILGRSLGIATYVSLSAMVVLGLWLRHPWRARFRRPGPESILWAHVSLAACTVALLIGHLTSLALDKYAGVGWTGVFVPWGAQFKPTGVALGTLAFYLLLLVVGTAALAGSIGRSVWFPIHTASVVVFCLCLVHGVLAGSDSVDLRWLYVGTGALVLVLQFTRWLAGTLKHGPAVTDA